MTAEPAGFDQRDERTAVAVLAADQKVLSGHDGGTRLEDGEVAVQRVEQRRPAVEGIRRVNQCEVIARTGFSGEEFGDVGPHETNRRRVAEAGRVEIGANSGDSPAVELDEADRSCSTRQCLDAKSPEPA